MFRLSKRVIKDIVTEKDGISFDPARILWVMGTLLFFGLVIYTTILLPSSFNMINFGMAFGGILAGGGASIKIKETTEQPLSNGGDQVTSGTEKT
jgi:hypothetical protein